MGGEQPTTWTIDNYDGEESWNECGQEPNNGHRGDGETNANQYHKLSGGVCRWGSATDDLIEKWDLEIVQDSNDHRNWRIQEWQRIKVGVRTTCMNMHREAEDQKDCEEMEESKSTSQNQLNIWRHAGQSYHVGAWRAGSHTTDTGNPEVRSLARVVRGTQKRIRKKSPNQTMNSRTKEKTNWYAACRGDSGNPDHSP